MSHDVLTPLARALLSTVAPASGTRATGSILAVASGASPVTLPANTYLVPVLEGEGGGKQTDEGLLLKTGLNPATELPFQQGGAWTVPGSGSLAVSVRSMLGGARHNLPAGTVLRWDPPVPGLTATAVVQAGGLAGGVDPSTPGGFLSAAWFPALGPQAFQDLFAAGLGRMPALLLSWVASDPVEPVVAGTRQGSTRARRDRRVFRETFVGYAIGSHQQSAGRRQAEGFELMHWLTDLWTDRMRNDDGEQVSFAAGGVNILSRRQLHKDPRFYVYEIAFSTQVIYSRTDTRAFGPWDKTRIVQQTESVAGPPPLPPLSIPDLTEPMD